MVLRTATIRTELDQYLSGTQIQFAGYGITPFQATDKSGSGLWFAWTFKFHHTPRHATTRKPDPNQECRADATALNNDFIFLES